MPNNKIPKNPPLPQGIRLDNYKTVTDDDYIKALCVIRKALIYRNSIEFNKYRMYATDCTLNAIIHLKTMKTKETK